MNIEQIVRMLMRRVLRPGINKLMRDKGVQPTPGAKKAGRMMRVARRFGRM